MSKKVETYRLGILGEEPLLSMEVLLKARYDFIEKLRWEPTQLRVSREAYSDLCEMIGLMADGLRGADTGRIVGLEIRVDEDLKERQWQVCKEDTKVYAL